MLEIGKDYSGQKRQKWQAFEKKVFIALFILDQHFKWQWLPQACDINPFLRYYSDAWPVKAFMQPHLHRLKSLVKTSCSHTRKSRTSGTTCPQLRSEGLRTRSQEALANKLNNTRPPDIIIIDDDSPEPTSHKDIVTSDPLILRDFLRGMHLKFDIDELIKSLLRMGISNKDQLVDVLTWPEEQQKAFFMLDVRMTCFEYRSLVHHLRAKLRD
ncbi:hypothetical protein QCA50_001267 [Cerrena zonata]|uniref:Uncharacterized protein n=1 Tax=Cerrena zonata TaxID=2478898 RepID=A0AAW0H0X6_9APHY